MTSATISTPTEAIVLNDKDFHFIRDLLRRKVGIDLSDDKRELVRSRLAKRVRALGCASLKSYVDTHIRPTTAAEKPEFTHFIDALSTNLTSFFREPVHFDFLRKTVLPNVLRSKRTVRGWCCACSTGEEPYSLAMTLLETADQSHDIRLLATDISTKVLAEAVNGVYPLKRLTNVSTHLRGKYFEPRRLPDGTSALAATPTMRSLITFRRLNLMDRLPFRGPLDFAFCRNVMIYFDRPTREALVGRISAVLAPGGYLFTGHSESLSGQSHALTQVAPAVYRKSP
ncbi:MAG: protein-glutamate O-methyltransferase CheR [Planctomycetota bacterium]